MTTTALDCETWRTRAGQKAPRLVCVAFGSVGTVPRLYHREGWRQWLPELIEAMRGDARLVNQNLPFDLAVLLVACRELFTAGKITAAAYREIRRLVWDGWQSGKFGDALIRCVLLSIARGEAQSFAGRKAERLPGYGLDEQLRALTGTEIAGKHGPDVWRQRYHELDDVPIADWPQTARDYASADPGYADQLWHAAGAAGRQLLGHDLPGERLNGQAAWALTLAECWGVRTDPRYVRALQRHVQHEIATAFAEIRRTQPPALPWLRPNGSRDMKAKAARVSAVWAAHIDGEPVPMTKGGAVSTARDTLDRIAPHAPDLAAWAAVGATKTDASTFLAPAARGVVLPINARWWTLVESERLSCRAPNLTNLPTREVDISDNPDPVVRAFKQRLQAQGLRTRLGIRNCYVPRDGFLYSMCDFDTAELRAFADLCLRWFGRSKMAEALIAEHAAREAGRDALDLHSLLAARILSISDAQAIERRKRDDPEFAPVRDLSKRIWFGRLGGMGDKRFLLQCVASGFDITLGGKLGTNPMAVVAQLGAIWFREFPEVPLYQRKISDALRQAGGRTMRVASLDGGLVRGNVGYTDACNHFFQNAVARWTKSALFQLQREGYNEPASAFHGSRVVVVPHDETIAEVPIARAHEAATRQQQVMAEHGQRLCPGVPVTCGVSLARRWYKGAKTRHDSEGKLTPWLPLT